VSASHRCVLFARALILTAASACAPDGTDATDAMRANDDAPDSAASIPAPPATAPPESLARADSLRRPHDGGQACRCDATCDCFNPFDDPTLPECTPEQETAMHARCFGPVGPLPPPELRA
jgi:hypothetical protein